MLRRSSRGNQMKIHSDTDEFGSVENKKSKETIALNKRETYCNFSFSIREQKVQQRDHCLLGYWADPAVFLLLLTNVER